MRATIHPPPLPVDVLQVCDALAAALADDPFYRAVTVEASDEDVRRQMLISYFALAYLECSEAGIAQLLAPDGGAFWNKPDVPFEHAQRLSIERRAGMNQLLGTRGFGNYLNICENMERQTPDALVDAWYLSILGVRPEAQGKGLASELLQTTLRRADAASSVCYLETFNPLSRPFYHRHGYTAEVQCYEPLTERSYWLMWRDPTVGQTVA